MSSFCALTKRLGEQALGTLPDSVLAISKHVITSGDPAAVASRSRPLTSHLVKCRYIRARRPLALRRVS